MARVKSLLAAAVLGAATTGLTAAPPPASDPSFTGVFSGWRWEIDPQTQPYPDYLADPRRPRMQVGAGVYNSSIPQVSDGRIMLDLGTRYTPWRRSGRGTTTTRSRWTWRAPCSPSST